LCGFVFCSPHCDKCKEHSKSFKPDAVHWPDRQTGYKALFGGKKANDDVYKNTQGEAWTGVPGCTCKVSQHMAMHNESCPGSSDMEANRHALRALMTTGEPMTEELAMKAYDKKIKDDQGMNALGATTSTTYAW
jgi:hypothetical protein